MIVLGERSSKWHTSATALGAEIAEATSVLPSEPGALQPLRARLTLLRRATILLLARSSGLAVKVEPKTLQRVLTSKWLIDAYLAVSVAKPLESLDDLFDLESDAGTLPLQVCSPFLSFPLIFFVVVLFNLFQSLSHTSLSLSHTTPFPRPNSALPTQHKQPPPNNPAVVALNAFCDEDRAKTQAEADAVIAAQAVADATTAAATTAATAAAVRARGEEMWKSQRAEAALQRAQQEARDDCSAQRSSVVLAPLPPRPSLMLAPLPPVAARPASAAGSTSSAATVTAAAAAVLSPRHHFLERPRGAAEGFVNAAWTIASDERRLAAFLTTGTGGAGGNESSSSLSPSSTALWAVLPAASAAAIPALAPAAAAPAPALGLGLASAALASAPDGSERFAA